MVKGGDWFSEVGFGENHNRAEGRSRLTDHHRLRYCRDVWVLFPIVDPGHHLRCPQPVFVRTIGIT